MKEGKNEILIELIVLPIQMACLGVSLFSKRAGVGAEIINFSLFIMTLLTDAILLRRRRITRSRAELKERLEKYELLERMNGRYLLAEEKRREASDEMRKRLRQRLVAARQAVKEIEKGGGHEHLRPLYQAEDSKRKICSGNSLLDVIFREKSEECREKNIDFQIQVYVPTEMEITDYHLCSIFNNLLDNAIEAVCMLPGTERRINAAANVQGDYLCIRISNGCTEEYSNRPNRNGHGLGKKIVEVIAKDYGGDFSLNFKDNIFVAEVVMRWKNYH